MTSREALTVRTEPEESNKKAQTNYRKYPESKRLDVKDFCYSMAEMLKRSGYDVLLVTGSYDHKQKIQRNEKSIK